MYLHIIVPEVIFLIRAGVGVVIHGTAPEAIEVLVATLERAEFRQDTEMPLAEKSRSVAGLLQQRRQGGMVRGQTNVPTDRQRLLQSEWQSILVAAGD